MIQDLGLVIQDVNLINRGLDLVIRAFYLVLVIRELYSLVRVFEAGLNLKFPRIKHGSSIRIKYIGFLNLDLFRGPYENPMLNSLCKILK